MDLIAEKREIFGKKTKNIRQENKVPAVLFGKAMESLPLVLDLRDFVKVYKEAGENTLVDLKIGNTTENVIIADVQFHPVTDGVLHVGFHKVDLTEKITADIPVVIVNEEENELVKSGQALVLVMHTAISVEALPTDLPHEFTLDVGTLSEIGEALTVADLSFDREKVAIEDLEEDEAIVKLDYAEMQEVEEEEISEEEAIAGIEVTEETASEGEEGAQEEPSKAEKSSETKEKPAE